VLLPGVGHADQANVGDKCQLETEESPLPFAARLGVARVWLVDDLKCQFPRPPRPALTMVICLPGVSMSAISRLCSLS